MKNLIIMGLISLTALVAKGQTLIIPGGPSTGIGTSPNSNVGIGTGTATPAFKLQVIPSTTGNSGIGIYNSGTGGSELRFQSSVSGSHSYGINNCGSTPDASLLGSFGIYDHSATPAAYRMMINANGNMGIGTNTPSQKLSVAGIIESTTGGIKFPNGTIQTIAATNEWVRNTTTIFPSGMTGANYTDKVAIGTNSVHTNFLNTAGGGQDARLMVKGGDIIVQEDPSNNASAPDGGADIYLLDPNGKGLDLYGQNGGAEIAAVGTGTSLHFSAGVYHGMIMHGDAGNEGKVQIGSVTSTPGNYKLYVKDGILTEKIKVAVHGSPNWADYVFADDYKLKSLEEVEEFVKENKHLPGVPSASELVKEGLNLGEMQAKQMEKIEELTLYMIDMKKEIELLKKENASLKSHNNKN